MEKSRKLYISFMMLSLKCVQPYFIWISNIIFNSETQIGTFNSPLDLNWDFWMLVLGCTSNFFLIHEEIENWDFWILL